MPFAEKLLGKILQNYFPLFFALFNIYERVLLILWHLLGYCNFQIAKNTNLYWVSDYVAAVKINQNVIHL